MRLPFGPACLAALALSPALAFAQPVDGASVSAVSALGLPVGAPVFVETVGRISSRTAKTGQRFHLVLTEPLRVNGRIVAPEGTPGVGEVIDAAPPGPLGRPGKLVLAARYLETDAGRIPLSGFHLGGAGRDNTDVIVGVGILFGVVGGVLADFVHGGQIEIPPGTEGEATIAALSADNAPKLASAAIAP